MINNVRLTEGSWNSYYQSLADGELLGKIDSVSRRVLGEDVEIRDGVTQLYSFICRSGCMEESCLHGRWAP